MAPSLTILVMLPHVLSNGAPPFFLFFISWFFLSLEVFSAWLAYLSAMVKICIVVGDGQDLHVVLP